MRFTRSRTTLVSLCGIAALSFGAVSCSDEPSDEEKCRAQIDVKIQQLLKDTRAGVETDTEPIPVCVSLPEDVQLEIFNDMIDKYGTEILKAAIVAEFN